MNRTIALPWVVAALAGALLIGCNKSEVTNPDDTAPVGVGSTEESAIKFYTLNDEFVKNDEETFSDREVQPTDYTTFGKIDVAITPLRWGRLITNVTTSVTVTIQPGDSIAIAHVEKVIMGTFKIKGVTGTGDTLVVDKPFTDQATRNVVFKRIGRETRRYWLNWVPVATSLVDGGTVQAATPVVITKLQMFLANGDTITVTDPNNFYLRYRWRPQFGNARHDVPELVGGQRVVMQVTLTSASPDTDIVVLRLGMGDFLRRRLRLQLISETPSGNAFVRVYQTPQWFVPLRVGFFHAGIDAMTRETLFDDTAPYSVSWWGVPYRVQ